MEKLAIRLANKISRELNYDDEKKEVVTYGLIALLQLVFTVFFVIVIGLFFGTPVEALIICFSVSCLRKYSGGAHVGTMGLCTFIGVAYSIGFSLIIRYLLLPVLSAPSLCFISVAVYMISFWAIYKLAPVDSPHKPIKTERKKKRMRKGAFLTLSFYMLVSIILLLLGKHELIFNSFALSLLFGILWQIFTLTKIGTAFLNRTDLIANILLGKKKEVTSE